MNPVRDNKEGKRRCEAEGMGGEMGQERAAGVPTLGSLRPTKHEIIFLLPQTPLQWGAYYF